MTTRIIVIILVVLECLIGIYVSYRSPWHLHLHSNIRVLTIAAALLALVAAAITTVLSQKMLAEHLAITSYIILILGVIFGIIGLFRKDEG